MSANRLESAEAMRPGLISKHLGVGLATLALPRFLGQALGLFHIGGGRGFWVFADADTLVLDLVFCWAIVSLWRSLRTNPLAEPTFWLLVFATGTIAVALAYAVTNFGTLFRLREMVTIGLCMLPLAMGGGTAALSR